MTKNDLSDHEFSSLGRWFERFAYTNIWTTTRLQMQFLVLNELTESGNGCLYRFGQWKRTGPDGNPIVWLNILKDGFLIYGMRPDTIVPEITPAMLRDALLRETEYLRAELSDPESQWRDVPKYRRYSVLTLCRILYSYITGEIASKPVAASWAMERIPKDLLVVLQATLSGDDKKLPGIEDISRFIDFVMRSISRVPVDHRSSTTNVS